MRPGSHSGSSHFAKSAVWSVGAVDSESGNRDRIAPGKLDTVGRRDVGDCGGGHLRQITPVDSAISIQFVAGSRKSAGLTAVIDRALIHRFGDVVRESKIGGGEVGSHNVQVLVVIDGQQSPAANSIAEGAMIKRIVIIYRSSVFDVNTIHSHIFEDSIGSPEQAAAFDIADIIARLTA